MQEAKQKFVDEPNSIITYTAALNIFIIAIVLGLFMGFFVREVVNFLVETKSFTATLPRMLNRRKYPAIDISEVIEVGNQNGYILTELANGKFVVWSTKEEGAIDLKHQAFTWNRSSHHFKDCCASKKKILKALPNMLSSRGILKKISDPTILVEFESLMEATNYELRQLIDGSWALFDKTRSCYLDVNNPLMTWFSNLHNCKIEPHKLSMKYVEHLLGNSGAFKGKIGEQCTVADKHDVQNTSSKSEFIKI